MLTWKLVRISKEKESAVVPDKPTNKLVNFFKFLKNLSLNKDVLVNGRMLINIPRNRTRIEDSH